MQAKEAFLVEDAEIMFRNFAGKEGPYNSDGTRSFALVLTPEFAAQLEKDGWNVKVTKEREEDGDILPGTPFLPVGVRFDIKPPTIYLVTESTRTALDENSVSILDWADIKLIDVMIRPYDWEYNGKTGTKAYVQSLFVTINEDPLERKYKVHENMESAPSE